MDNKKVITDIENKNGGKLNQYKSPYKNEKVISKTKNLNYLEGVNNNFVHEITKDKDNKLFQEFLQNYNNNIDNFQFDENAYRFPISNKELTEPNKYDNNSSNKINQKNNNKNKVLKNLNMKANNVIDIKNIKNINLNTNIHQSLSPNKQSTSFSENMNNVYDSKYSFKMNKIKDDYIDFLQKEFEDNAKKSIKLDSNNKELLKKCDDLIHDNRILSNILNDRTAQLNKIIQENLTVKSELDKNLLINQKNEQKLEFYEEQFNLYKASNENYQKIIEELKGQINQLNLNLTEIQKNNEENLEENEKNYQKNLKTELENNKKEIEEIYENKIKDEKEINEQKMQEMLEHIKTLEEKNDELSNELNKKESMFDMVCKENEKLTGENNLFRNEVEQYSNQISELNTIIKHKDNIINNLKVENSNNEKLLNKSSSCSMMKLDGSEFINENITKLISDNEENKMKIELLNNKLKNFDELEKKYNEIINNNRMLSLSEKLSSQLNSNDASPKNSNSSKTHFNYNNFNEIKNSTYQKNTNTSLNSNQRANFRSFVSPKKLNLQGVEDSRPNSPKPLQAYNTNNKIVISSSNTKNATTTTNDKAKNITYNVNNSNTTKRNNFVVNSTKNGVDREIKVTKRTSKNVIKDGKDIKEITLSKKVETSPSPNALRYYNRNNEKDKVQIKYENDSKIVWKNQQQEKKVISSPKIEINKKTNFTYKPKEIGVNLLKNKPETNININSPKVTIIHPEKEEDIAKEEFYLYGIDRNNLFHVFDINNRKWSVLKKITELKDDSNSFKKDYQYEGTILYNTLKGLYILTGEKTDILYFFNSLTNSISKICKFNNSHDNGSLFLDSITNCLYVFGGKNIKSCEYYSFNEKKIYKLPDLIIDRANASYIVSNNKIFAFFGFSYSKNTYSNSIEYMDYTRKDRWIELRNIKLLKNNITFDMESVSTMYYKNNLNLILIYCGIQGDDEDFVSQYYLVYDTKNNTMDKINIWNMQQYKYGGNYWKNYSFKSDDPKGFHFAKNSRFLKLPKNNSYDGYNNKDNIDVLIDYKNNVHFILQEKQKIDIYRNEL